MMNRLFFHKTKLCLCLFLVLASSTKAQSWDFDDGTAFTSGQLCYVVDTSRGAAECRGFAEGQSASQIDIPATVTNNGSSYEVVSIGEFAFNHSELSQLTLHEGLRCIRMSAFLDCQLTSITVPASVTEIQDGALLMNTLTEAHLLGPSLQMGQTVFGGGLQRLYMSAVTPPQLDYYLAVDYTNFSFPLVRVYVPEGSLEAYLSNEWWAQHAIIEGLEERTVSVTTQRVGMLAEAIRGQGLHFKAVNNLIVKGPLGDDDIYFIRDSLTSLFTVDMSQATIRQLPKNAFQNCRFSSIQLPASLIDMGNSAFGVCHNLEEIVIPEGVLFADNLVYNCSKLKHLDLPSTLVSAKELMTVISIGDDATFSCVITCRALLPPMAKENNILSIGDADIRLNVPAMSASAYANATGWKELAQEPISCIPLNINVLGSKELSSDVLPDNYQPNLKLVQKGNYGAYSSINSFGWLTITGSKPLHLGHFSAYNDLAGSLYDTHQGCELLTQAPVTAESVSLDLDISEARWYFMSFPFDVKLSDVITDSRIQHWVVRSYSGSNRAAMRGQQWIDVPYTGTLEGRRGYAWMVATSNDLEGDSYDDLRLTVSAAGASVNNLFANEDVSIPLSDYASTYEHNASWNLVGNPYPCYYRIGDLQLTAPITVWTDSYSYEQYRTLSPLDDADRVLRPYEAFFVQKPSAVSALVFSADGRVAPGSSLNRAQRLQATNGSRQLLNLMLTADGMSDYTRVVLNEEAWLGYERARDAAKFFADNTDVPQLYTYVNSVPCAINERPEADGTVLLGVRTGCEQTCTIAIEDAFQEPVLLEDRLAGTLTDLTKQAYTFLSNPGADDQRFVLHVGSSTTGISEALTADEDRQGRCYNLLGQPIKDNSFGGIVIDNGRLTIKR